MLASIFEFFEVIAAELTATPSMVITKEDFQINDKDSPLLESLIAELKAVGPEDAIRNAVTRLELHFRGKGAELPFEYLPETGRFTAKDQDFLSFVNDMSDIRTLGKRSRDFECSVATRLGGRTTGEIHRVGHPRDHKKRKKDFNAHLEMLGFSRPVLLGKGKDGGFDVIWMLPLGTKPHQPFVSVQCKNSEFNLDAADKSFGPAIRSFSQHGGLQPSVHVPCVLFNDYIQSESLTRKQLNFVPLGLTDLAKINPQSKVELI